MLASKQQRNIARVQRGTKRENGAVSCIAGALAEEYANDGYSGHFPFARMPGEVRAASAADIAQWCLPLRRQQAGRSLLESAKNAGPISEKLKSKSSNVEFKRRKRSL